jgi:type II secretory pathway pseudopilin PulG
MIVSRLSSVGRRVRSEHGSMLIELLIAMTFLAVTIGALMTVYTSTVLSLRHTSIEGNALTVVDKQLEIFRTLPYGSIALDSSTIPSASDVYATSPPNNLSAAQKSSITSGQTTGGTYSATQTVTGPDNRTYRVDTYVFPNTPSSGQAGKQVTVAARLMTGTTAGPIRAQAVSPFDVGGTQDATN